MTASSSTSRPTVFTRSSCVRVLSGFGRTFVKCTVFRFLPVWQYGPEGYLPGLRKYQRCRRPLLTIVP